MLPKSKALLEGGQKMYTKNATAQGQVLIQRRTEYRTGWKLVTRVTAISISIYPLLQHFTEPLNMSGGSKLSLQLFSNNIDLIHLAALGILKQSNKVGAWLPQDSERLQVNVFKQLWSPQLMGLLGLKYI